MYEFNKNYPRDLIGYANNPINPRWPKNAKIALQFALNYEEGAESCILHGDEVSEVFLSDMSNPKAFNQRHQSIETLYEYGSRVGIWRLLKLFKDFEVPVTIFGVAMAIARNKKLAEYLAKENYDICSHGYRWINYQEVEESVERDHLYKSIEIIEKIMGTRPLGWYTGRDSQNTRRLVVEEGGFLYDSDAYNDELPYFAHEITSKEHLVIPYSMDTNDMRFVSGGFQTSEQFYTYLKDSFDTLYLEGEEGTPKMMNIGMHCRILGRPGKYTAIKRFLEYVRNFDDVWFAKRIDIANHWINSFGEKKEINV